MRIHRLSGIAVCALGSMTLVWPIGGIGQTLDPAASNPTLVEVESADARPLRRDRYFPFGDGAEADFLERWYGNQLAAMREPVLQAMQPTDGRNAYVMRVLFLPSFHPAYAVRIDAREGRPTVRMTTLTGAGGYAPGRVATARSETIRRDLANTIAALNRAAEIDVQDALDDGSANICVDGMRVVVELVDENGYHVLERHICELTRQLHDVVVAAATIAAPLPEHIRRYL